MYKANTLKIINNEIEVKREELNELVLIKSDKDLILKLSVELDGLLNLYYLENIQHP
ncbi:aspartyl-phosphate phosphatase Spo0E family protein [Tissierella creatinophila]|uniref:Spo0E like sporulation regulatory protein n=1 Tax=Tissierella creatinophila DSM 6911 TaxID=1123403 RepID=A0A1U7M428_TISCR|nr:aspartyl-phosphate phosphatase Spo0E family protein [Tissierella creatinophila]OLS01969.1 hypothetical protein TICRE_21110 [Tissierella creatinophila DSM 6911]